MFMAFSSKKILENTFLTAEILQLKNKKSYSKPF
jgi:hypothetical protein